jgi:hypothetical protein
VDRKGLLSGIAKVNPNVPEDASCGELVEPE